MYINGKSMNMIRMINIIYIYIIWHGQEGHGATVCVCVCVCASVCKNVVYTVYMGMDVS